MSHGPLMLDLQGVELTNQERELLLHPAAGGVILFRRNFETPDQLNRLVSSIHALREPKLLVAVDQEGVGYNAFVRVLPDFRQLPGLVACMMTIRISRWRQFRALVG